MQKTVIINRGIPASGKSTFASEILLAMRDKEIEATIHSTDTYFMCEGEYRFEPSKLREYHLENQKAFEASLVSGVEVVICDNTNIEPWEALPYYEMAKAHDYHVILMDFKPRNIQEHIDAQHNDDYPHTIPQEQIVEMGARYATYAPLTAKHSYPNSTQPLRGYDEKSKSVTTNDTPSHPFYYDALITIEPSTFTQTKPIIGKMLFAKIRDYDLDSIKLIPKQHQIIMQAFEKKENRTLTAYDLEKALGKSIKQTERYIEELQEEFHNIIDLKVGRRKGYKLIDTFDIFVEAFEKHSDMRELMELINEQDNRLFQELEKHSSKSKNKNYLFKNPIFEFLGDNAIFTNLKQKITLHEYCTITFDTSNQALEVKPIKLLFTDNNWYLAYVDESEILRLGRVAFIEKLGYSKKNKNSYQPKSIQKHLTLLENRLQNAMSLFDENIPVQTAHLKASPAIAKYFKENMKRFFPTQTFLKQTQESDGVSVEFTIDYTQDLEILPFIQKWMPDLIILKPDSLKQSYLKKLEKMQQRLKEQS